MKFFLKYFSHVIFALALSYYALLAFVIETNPMVNKMIMVIIAGFWILWIFAKSFVKILAAIALLLAMCFAGYYIMNADKIECKKSGKEWNEKLQICEEKKTTSEKIKNAVTNVLKDAMNKFKENKTDNKPETSESEKSNNNVQEKETTKEPIPEKETLKEKIKDKIISKVKSTDQKNEQENTSSLEEKTESDESVSVQEVIKEMIKDTIKETIAAQNEATQNEAQDE